MRAVSLSNTQVISLLNRYFVPVFVSNEDYRESGCASAEERAELRRIHREGYAAGLSVGTVHAFVLAPDGHLLDSMHTVQVSKPELLVAMLERAAKKLGTPPGGPVVKPEPPAPPACAAGELRLHLVARYLERRGGELLPVENAGGNWSALPGEDWIMLGREQWKRLLPPGEVRVGASWTIDPKVAGALLAHFYPPTENNDLATNRIERATLSATLVSVTGHTARARLEGSLRMRHPFYHKEDANEAHATVAGYVDLDVAAKTIQRMAVATTEATYGSAHQELPYGVALTAAR